jgi:hypothetical protein
MQSCGRAVAWPCGTSACLPPHGARHGARAGHDARDHFLTYARGFAAEKSFGIAVLRRKSERSAYSAD